MTDQWNLASRATLIFLGLYGVYATFWSAIGWVLGVGLFSISLTALISVAAVGGAWLMRHRIDALLRWASDAVRPFTWPSWVALVLLLGVAARLSWVLIFPTEPVSDGRTYLNLSSALLAGEYGWDGAKAHWPPGYPLGLMPMVAVFGPGKLASLVYGFVLLFAFVAYVALIARRFLTEGSARLVVLVSCLWPGLVTHSGASKELQTTVLLLGAVYCYLLLAEGNAVGLRQRWFLNALTCGLFLGAAVLTQPGTMLLIAVVAIALVILSKDLARTSLVVSASLLGVVVVMAPWTLRNYIVLDEFIPVSTNSGSVLYRANHDLANGGYLKLDVPYGNLGEVEQSRLLTRDAFDWIAANPARFARLAVLKQLNFLGRHATGVYWTVRHSPIVSDATYAAMRAAMVLFGAALYLTMVVRVASAPWKDAFPFVLFTTGAWSYLFLVDTIGEAGGRHFIPLLPLLIILAVGCVRQPSLARAASKAE